MFFPSASVKEVAKIGIDGIGINKEPKGLICFVNLYFSGLEILGVVSGFSLTKLTSGPASSHEV